MTAIEQAKIIYPMLVKLAKEGKTIKERKTIPYGEVGKALGYKNNVSGCAFRYGLDIIVFYCLEGDFPQLTTLIVNKAGGLPSNTYAYDKGIDFDEQQSKSCNHKWEKTIDYSGIWDRRFELRVKHNIG